MKAKSKSQEKRIQAQEANQHLRAEKPVVHFGGRSVTHRAISGQVVGTVLDVTDHPRLGRESIVYTSEVQKVTIETRNTIYVWEKPESPRGSSVPG